MNPTKTGLYSTNVGDRFILLYWDGEDWVDQDGIRPRYKEVHWKGKPLFVPALRTWVGLTVTTILNMMPSTIPAEYDGELMEFARAVETKLKEKNNG